MSDKVKKGMLSARISPYVQSAGADVANRLNALVTLLEKVNEKPPEVRRCRLTPPSG